MLSLKWKHSLKFTFLLLCCTWLLTACSTYKPSYIPSPSFKEKGDLFLEAHTGSMFGANLAYSPLNHLYFMAELSGNFPLEEEIDSNLFVNQDDHLTNEVKYFNYQHSVAVGSYWDYNEEFKQSVSLGMGSGVGSGLPFNLDFGFFDDDPDLYAVEGTYELYFLQSSVEYLFAEGQSITFNGRVNYLNYYDFRFIYGEPFLGFNPNAQNLPPASEINNLFRYKERFVFQLGVTARYQLDFVEFFGQFQLAVQDTYAEDFFRARRYNLFLGVSVPVHKLWKNR